MKLFHILSLSFALAFSAIQMQAQSTNDNNSFLHTVSKGQSLYSIAKMYNVGVDDIVRLNPGSEKQINAGSTLRIPQAVQPEMNKSSFHTIQAGETLYQLSIKYQLTVESICDANPGLSAQNFKIGQVIAIPTQTAQNILQKPKPVHKNDVKPKGWKDMHKIKRKETIFSISRMYGITQEELIAANPEIKDQKLRKGEFLFIPYGKSDAVKNDSKESQPVTAPTNEELFNQNRMDVKDIKTIKAGIMLPFMATGSGEKKEEQIRMIEYYEGLLLAVDSLKKQGVCMELFTYDTKKGQQTLKSILAKPEVKKLDIIFGPAASSNVAILAQFAKENNIRLVIPFAPKVDEVFNNAKIYQINTPQSYLYSEVYDHFVRKFDKKNIIFVHANAVDNDKEEFINGLKNECKNNKINYKEILLSNEATTNEVIAAMDTLGNNIFIPTSGRNTSLVRILPLLTQITREHPHFNMHMFGYPEWQTYTHEHLASFYELDTYFYSSFYTNTLFPEAVDFTKKYRRWYSKDMASIYPKYGMLGFDTAYFFLKGLADYGNNLDSNINNVSVTPIQTGFKFERVNNWGGFINRKVFFIHFTKNYELVKLNFE